MFFKNVMAFLFECLDVLFQLWDAYTLNRKCMISPS